ncbi:MAG TPA: hypothetical protein VNZ22_15705, partial [Bacillota bacterium]|nr:hypothetical protein [Bacillota bacterium]
MTATRFLNGLAIALILGVNPGLTVARGEANAPAASGKSQWVHFDSDGQLVYKPLERGDRIMDFSFAGYMGGGVALPSVPAKITLNPSGGDDTVAIQEAIEAVSKMELVDGFRGAVLLKPGTYNCSRTLALTASGVVLRGSGSGTNGTILKM